MTEPHAGIGQPDLIGAEDAVTAGGAATSETDSSPCSRIALAHSSRVCLRQAHR